MYFSPSLGADSFLPIAGLQFIHSFINSFIYQKYVKQPETKAATANSSRSLSPSEMHREIHNFYVK